MIDKTTLMARFAVALLGSTLLYSMAGAANLPDISPDQIRQDTERRHNSLTGQSELVAPNFDPFELDETLAGTAALRSASYATTIDGRSVSGGAFLDLALIYTTGSNDPYDVRGVERAVYLSGEPVDSISYDSRVLDCSENTREVVYDDTYYSGASYGYLAGVYRLFPRYRGHRHFGQHRGYGYRNGYRGRHYRGVRGNRGRHYDRRNHHADRNDYADRDGRRGRRHDHDRGDGARDGRDRDRSDRGGRNGRNADGRGGRNRDRTATAETGTLVTIPNRRGNRGNRPGRAERGTKERMHQDQRRNTRHNRKDPKRYTATQSGTPKQPQQSRPRVRVETPPQSQTRTAKAPRRTVKTPTLERARPTPARTEKAPTRSRPARHTSKAPKSERRAVSRSVDRHFGSKKSNNSSRSSNGVSRKKVHNFYPMQMGGYQRVDVSVSYRCAREEALTLHIPQERLDAARFEGFTVLLLDRENQEIPVYIPPNYVEGFRQAAGGQSYSALQPSGYPQPVPPQPVQTRDPNSPIIYGETGL